MLESIAIGVFVFVALAVGGCRAIDIIRNARRSIEPRRKVTPYTGPRYNAHGREVTSERPRRRFV